MQYTILINQQKAVEWGLDLTLATLFAFLYQVPSWADQQTKDNEAWFRISKGKLAEELPIITDKPDTIYRQMKRLAEKGLIELTSSGPKTLFRLTAEGKTWNRKVGRKSEVARNHAAENLGTESEVTSEQNPTFENAISDLNPSYIGPESELTSDLNPTDHITRSSNQSGKYKNFDFSRWPTMPEQQVLDDWFRSRKRIKAEVTQTAINRMAGKLVECLAAGYSVNLCLSEAVLRGWRGLELEWLQNGKVKPDTQQHGSGGRPVSREQTILTDLQEAHAEIQTLKRLNQSVPDALASRYAALRQQLHELRGDNR